MRLLDASRTDCVAPLLQATCYMMISQVPNKQSWWLTNNFTAVPSTMSKRLKPTVNNVNKVHLPLSYVEIREEMRVRALVGQLSLVGVAERQSSFANPSRLAKADD
jgi:hypothetical protein